MPASSSSFSFPDDISGPKPDTVSDRSETLPSTFSKRESITSSSDLRPSISVDICPIRAISDSETAFGFSTSPFPDFSLRLSERSKGLSDSSTDRSDRPSADESEAISPSCFPTEIVLVISSPVPGTGASPSSSLRSSKGSILYSSFSSIRGSDTDVTLRISPEDPSFAFSSKGEAPADSGACARLSSNFGTPGLTVDWKESVSGEAGSGNGSFVGISASKGDSLSSSVDVSLLSVNSSILSIRLCPFVRLANTDFSFPPIPSKFLAISSSFTDSPIELTRPERLGFPFVLDSCSGKGLEPGGVKPGNGLAACCPGPEKGSPEWLAGPGNGF